MQLWGVAVLSLLLLGALPGGIPIQKLPFCEDSLSLTVFLCLFSAALLCEYIDSSLGMGYGTALTPLLLLLGFKPLEIVPCVLFSECLTGLSAGLMHQYDGNINFFGDRQSQKTTLLLCTLSTAGSLLAVMLALSLPDFWLKAIISTIILAAGIIIIGTRHQKFHYHSKHVAAVGLLAAFNKALSGGGYGPLVTSGQIVSGVGPKQAVAITSLTEGFTCAIGFGAYVMLKGTLDLKLITPLTLGALFSVPLSTFTVSKLSDERMRSGVGAAAVSLGLFSLLGLAG